MTEISIFEQTDDKYILDMTCGGRSIWFQKNHPNTIFFDRRDVEYEQTFGSNPSARHIRVHPDVMGDFRELPFDDNTFNLVVFDPPHIVGGANDGSRKPMGNMPRRKKPSIPFREASKRGCECLSRKERSSSNGRTQAFRLKRLSKDAAIRLSSGIARGRRAERIGCAL